MFHFLRYAVFAFISAIVGAHGSASAASPLTPVELGSVAHGDATLTIVSSSGDERLFTVEDVEALPTYRVVTKTPWRDTATFDGVLLVDLLEAGGLGDVEGVLVTADNDFTSVIPRAVWQDVPLLVATRANGRPLSRRERGPFLFVIEHEAYEASSIAAEGHLVWMAARIEPTE